MAWGEGVDEQQLRSNEIFQLYIHVQENGGIRNYVYAWYVCFDYDFPPDCCILLGSATSSEDLLKSGTNEPLQLSRLHGVAYLFCTFERVLQVFMLTGNVRYHQFACNPVQVHPTSIILQCLHEDFHQLIVVGWRR